MIFGVMVSVAIWMMSIFCSVVFGVVVFVRCVISNNLTKIIIMKKNFT